MAWLKTENGSWMNTKDFYKLTVSDRELFVITYFGQKGIIRSEDEGNHKELQQVLDTLILKITQGFQLIDIKNIIKEISDPHVEDSGSCLPEDKSETIEGIQEM